MTHFAAQITLLCLVLVSAAKAPKGPSAKPDRSPDIYIGLNHYQHHIEVCLGSLILQLAEYGTMLLKIMEAPRVQAKVQGAVVGVEVGLPDHGSTRETSPGT